MKCLLGILLGTLLLLAPLTAGATGQPTEPAADFTLQDTSDVWHTMSDHTGEVVFLFFLGYS